VGVLRGVAVGLREGTVGALVRKAVGLAAWVAVGVGTRGVGDEGTWVAVGWPVGVVLGSLLAVGEGAVADGRQVGWAVSVAETALAIAVAAVP
jgi:hypothetical protein